MAFRHESKITYKTIVVCDDCKKETTLSDGDSLPLGFDNRMNGAITKGYTFKTYGGKEYKNYCKECKLVHG